jgi:hypothetical protein
MSEDWKSSIRCAGVRGFVIESCKRQRLRMTIMILWGADSGRHGVVDKVDDCADARRLSIMIGGRSAPQQ